MSTLDDVITKILTDVECGLMPTLDEVITKILTDLEWRGPNGKPLRYVVLERDMASVVLTFLVKRSTEGKD